ncbi:SurA N-terminal domain-containing protein [Bacillus shivajii]|uniref:SurA N-terminal domain-containing protein n=1 Tax=Bacillus shivajii TaxID=1983719 RepID=UPI001CFBAB13|nr:SurA N-terminal domain-containing protein [Bacillus shivajii]UCZ54054.1 SurA N-terminal domain-containing protein [Bacillus shivajii]
MNKNSLIKRVIPFFLLVMIFLLAACSEEEVTETVNDPDQDSEVETSGVLATVDDTEITSDTVEFQQLLGLLHLEMVRAEGAASMDEETLDYMKEFWDQQEEQVRNINHTLTSMIRTLAMEKLAEEKGHTVSAEEILAQYEQFTEQYKHFPETQSLIEEYGTERFSHNLEGYTKSWLMARKVYEDVYYDVENDNPNMEEDELQYLASEQYEELLVSQMETVQVNIHSLEGYH